MELNEFGFDIVYRSGKLNSAPDALSVLACMGLHFTISMPRCVTWSLLC